MNVWKISQIRSEEVQYFSCFSSIVQGLCDSFKAEGWKERVLNVYYQCN